MRTIQSDAADAVASVALAAGPDFSILMEFFFDCVRARQKTREAIAAHDAASRAGKPTKKCAEIVRAAQLQEAAIDRRTEDLFNAYIDHRAQGAHAP